MVKVPDHVDDFVFGFSDSTTEAEVEVLNQHNLGCKPDVGKLVSAGLAELHSGEHAAVNSFDIGASSLKELVLDRNDGTAAEDYAA